MELMAESVCFRLNGGRSRDMVPEEGWFYQSLSFFVLAFTWIYGDVIVKNVTAMSEEPECHLSFLW